MPATLHPGVYVFETPSPARSIEAAATSTAIFVGPAERGPLMPTKLTSRTDYARQFGGYNRQATSGLAPSLGYAMDAFFKNGGTTAYMLRAFSGAATAATASRSGGGGGGGPAFKILATSPGTWANGTLTGGLFAVTLPSTDAASGKFRIVVVYTPLDTGVQQIVEDFDHLSIDSRDENYLVDSLNRSLYIRWDPATTPAVPTTLDGGAGLDAAGIMLLAVPAKNTQLTGGSGGAADLAVPGDYNFSLLDDITDASIICCPSTRDDSQVNSLNSAVIGYAQTRAHLDLFAICDLPRHNAEALATNAVQDVVADFNLASLPKSNYAALYWPWLKISDPIGVGKNPQIFVSPSASVAGIFARTDGSRGVWKAPAGLEATVLGINDLEFKVQDIQQDVLNPLGINAIRNQPAGGPVVWGARTMVPASEWRYVPVRRMAIFLRQSIYNGIQFAVFEPNDEPLWSALRLTIGGFMDRLFRQGAFAGATPKDAFFVKCDSETTTSSDQLAGFVNVLVGFSPLRPAEFVVVKLSQIVSQKA